MKRYPKDTLARVLIETGHHEDARVLVRELIVEYPDEPAYRELLSRVERGVHP